MNTNQSPLGAKNHKLKVNCCGTGRTGHEKKLKAARKVSLIPWFSSHTTPGVDAYVSPEQDNPTKGCITFEKAYFPLGSLLIVKGLTEFEWERIDYGWSTMELISLSRSYPDIKPVVFTHEDGTSELMWEWGCGFCEASS